jgi:hypothetical protein
MGLLYLVLFLVRDVNVVPSNTHPNVALTIALTEERRRASVAGALISNYRELVLGII